MRRAAVWAALAVVVFATGCGSDSDDDDSGGSASASPTSSTAPPRTTVTNPRDASVLITDPCAAFTPEQLARYDLAATGELQDKPSVGAPAKCTWSHHDLFRNQNASVFLERLPEPTDALGYLDTGRDKRLDHVVVSGNQGSLGQIVVGDTQCWARTLVSSTEVLIVIYEQHRDATTDPCGPARELAEFAVSNLPPRE